MDKNEIHHVDQKRESLDVEKPAQMVTIENIQVLGLSSEDVDFYTNYPEEKRKKVIHKVNFVSLPLIPPPLPRLILHGKIYYQENSTLTHSSTFVCWVLQVDIRLVPMLAVLYLISHIDRANIGVSTFCTRKSIIRGGEKSGRFESSI